MNGMTCRIDDERIATRARKLRSRVMRVLLRKALAMFADWRQRRRDAWRRAAALDQLNQLSDRMLRDIGMQRGDLYRWG